MSASASSWPWFLCCAPCLVLGAALAVWNRPLPLPAEDSLVRFSGAIERVVVRSDVGGPGFTGAPLDSVYFRLAGVPHEFRYRSGMPKYFEVRDSVAHAIDVWVDERDLGAGAVPIYQLHERNPYEPEEAQVRIDFHEIAERLREAPASWRRVGLWLLAAGAIAAAVGFLLRRHRWASK